LSRSFSDKVAFSLFVVSTAAGLFLLGFFSARNKWFPHNLIERKVETLKKGGEEAIKKLKPAHLHPAHYAFSGARTHNREAMGSGLTLVTGYWPDFDWKAGAKLIDDAGNTVHAWNLDPAFIWKDDPHYDTDRNKFNTSANYLHGSYLFPNGDLLFNTEYMGLARVNAAGEVIWRLSYRAHHAIHPDESGNFWACAIRWVDNNEPGRQYLSEHYPSLKVPLVEEHALLVSPDGIVLEDINITKAFMENPVLRRMIWRFKIRPDKDVLHVNDVEPLPSSLASQYPGINAGDILISARHVHALFIIDRATHRIKWHAVTGFDPHDPDFIGNNEIGLFNNNLDETLNGTALGGSQITALNLSTLAEYSMYPASPTNAFYTPFGGKWQSLDNGNKLITEARRGRIFEVDNAGNLIWEWVTGKYDEKLVPEMLEGTRYPLTREQVAGWSSKGSTP